MKTQRSREQIMNERIALGVGPTYGTHVDTLLLETLLDIRELLHPVSLELLVKQYNEAVKLPVEDIKLESVCLCEYAKDKESMTGYCPKHKVYIQKTNLPEAPSQLIDVIELLHECGGEMKERGNIPTGNYIVVKNDPTRNSEIEYQTLYQCESCKSVILK